MVHGPPVDPRTGQVAALTGRAARARASSSRCRATVTYSPQYERGRGQGAARTQHATNVNWHTGAPSLRGSEPECQASDAGVQAKSAGAMSASTVPPALCY